MSYAVHSLAGLLLDVSIRAFALAVVAGLVVVCVRKRSAAMEHAVWTGVLAGMLLLPLARPVTPNVTITTSSPQVKRIASQWRGIAAESPTLSQPAPIIVRSDDNPDPDRWLRYGLIIYFGGMLVLLARLAAGVVLTRRSLESLRNIRGEAGVRALVSGGELLTIPVCESNDVRGPLTAGWPGGIVILPMEWRSWSAEKLRMVLTHEAAHVDRRDSMVTLLAAINRAVFWFHPVAWFVERRLTVLAELAADDAVLESNHDAHGYADALIEIAGQKRSRRFSSAIAMAGAGKIGRRIDRILKGRTGSGRVGMWTRGAVWAGSLAMLGATAMLHVRILNAQQYPQRIPAEFMGLPHESGEMPKAAQQRAAELEQTLSQNPEAMTARVELCQLYWAFGQNDRRWPLVAWLIENHPEAEIFARPGGNPFRADARGDAHQREVTLWRIQVEKHRDTAAVLRNASQAMDDVREQIALLRKAFALEPKLHAMPGIFNLYAMALTLGDRCTTAPEDQFCDPAVAESVRSDLASSNDPAFLGTVAIQIVGRAASAELTHRRDLDIEALRSLSMNLLTRAASLDPGNEDWPNAMEGARRLGVPSEN